MKAHVNSTDKYANLHFLFERRQIKHRDQTKWNLNRQAPTGNWVIHIAKPQKYQARWNVTVFLALSFDSQTVILYPIVFMVFNTFCVRYLWIVAGARFPYPCATFMSAIKHRVPFGVIVFYSILRAEYGKFVDFGSLSCPQAQSKPNWMGYGRVSFPSK